MQSWLPLHVADASTTSEQNPDRTTRRVQLQRSENISSEPWQTEAREPPADATWRLGAAGSARMSCIAAAPRGIGLRLAPYWKVRRHFHFLARESLWQKTNMM